MAVDLASPQNLSAIAGIRLASTRAIKAKRRDDLSVIAIDKGATMAGVFTQNRFPAAPVTVCREHLDAKKDIRALAINAGIANAGTLGGGLKDAKDSCRLLAKLLGCRPTQVLPFSTGVIMERLPMTRYADGLVRCVNALSPDNWLGVSNAIMTTDTVAKGASQQCGEFNITGIAKGSGMIHPNMGTMLAFVATDAALPQPLLARWQKQITANTFNAISVDGDTSTNDSFTLIATGKAGAPRNRAATAALKTAINEVCTTLAEAIVRDGEGAKKLVHIVVDGGNNRTICQNVAVAVACSPLVKTAIAAGDANIGRLLMAIGNAGKGFKPDTVCVRINDAPIVKGGGIHPQYDEKRTARHLANNEFTVHITLGNGKHAIHYKTCDLTHRYIEINADYRS